MSKQQTFIDTYAPFAVRATGGTGIFPSVQLAQAILESGWGTGTGLRMAKNMFNIKNFGNWEGGSYCFNTDEYINGSQTFGKECFRVYNNVQESFKDHVNFLKVNPRYTKNGVFNSNTPEEQAQALQRAGFATHPQYAQLLIDVINKYNLKQFDRNGMFSDAHPLVYVAEYTLIALIIALVVLVVVKRKKLNRLFTQKLTIA